MGCAVTKPSDPKDTVRVESVRFFRDNDGEKGDPLSDAVFHVNDLRLHAQAKLSELVPGIDGRVVWICKDWSLTQTEFNFHFLA